VIQDQYGITASSGVQALIADADGHLSSSLQACPCNPVDTSSCDGQAVVGPFYSSASPDSAYGQKLSKLAHITGHLTRHEHEILLQLKQPSAQFVATHGAVLQFNSGMLHRKQALGRVQLQQCMAHNNETNNYQRRVSLLSGTKQSSGCCEF
jgi:hypothetical protein